MLSPMADEILKVQSRYPNEIIKLKIKRNNKVILMLELENKISKLEMILKHRLVINHVKCIEDLKKINTLEVLQFSNYSPARSCEVAHLASVINNEYVMVEDINPSIVESRDKIIAMMDEIKKIDSSISIMSYASKGIFII